jgi:hypothetical protein
VSSSDHWWAGLSWHRRPMRRFVRGGPNGVAERFGMNTSRAASENHESLGRSGVLISARTPV